MSESLEDADYDHLLEEVAPGKLIRSELFEWLIRRMRDLEQRVGPADLVQVPNLTGRTLGRAVGILGQQSVRLRMGPVLDLSGSTVDPSRSANQGRVVLTQMPAPEDQVRADRLVRLVVADAQEQSLLAPEIRGFDKDPVRVNQVVTIQGRNFPTTWAPAQGDEVTFDGVTGTVQLGDTTSQEIAVRVPGNIPNVPDTGDQVTQVPVTVTVRGAKSATAKLGVQPATDQAVPTISAINPVSGSNIQPESTIEIQGSNFSDTAGENTVIFKGSIRKPATAVTSGGIEATVPSAQELGLSSPGGDVNVAVEVDGVKSGVTSIFVSLVST